MKKKQIGGATLYHARMENVIPSIRFDHIFTDPPYLYIKTHDFDRKFDEALLFENAKRILPDIGFVARSESFGVACVNTGRKYIGSEIDEGYFDIAYKRIKEAAKNNALFMEAV